MAAALLWVIYKTVLSNMYQEAKTSIAQIRPLREHRMLIYLEWFLKEKHSRISWKAGRQLSLLEGHLSPYGLKPLNCSSFILLSVNQIQLQKLQTATFITELPL